jgi:hypothetical protein
MRLKNGWWIPGPRQLAIVFIITCGLYATLMAIEPDLPDAPPAEVERRARDPIRKAKKNVQKALQWLLGGGLGTKEPEKPAEKPEQKKGDTP